MNSISKIYVLLIIIFSCISPFSMVCMEDDENMFAFQLLNVEEIDYSDEASGRQTEEENDTSETTSVAQLPKLPSIATLFPTLLPTAADSNPIAEPYFCLCKQFKGKNYMDIYNHIKRKHKQKSPCACLPELIPTTIEIVQHLSKDHKLFIICTCNLLFHPWEYNNHCDESHQPKRMRRRKKNPRINIWKEN